MARTNGLGCLLLAGSLLLAQPGTTTAGDWDLTLYGGLALPTYDETLRFGLPRAGAPGVDVSPSNDLVLEAKGDLVFGGALALELGGFFGIEARVDTAKIDIETQGVRYDAAVDLPPLGSLPASVTIGAGSFELERLVVLSLNARLRTPGAISLFASGGVSYLPRLEARGTVPLDLELAGLPILPGASGRLRLVALPTQSDHSIGLNAGAGIRLGLGEHLSLLGEARGFLFRDYDLGFDLTTTPAFPAASDLVESLGTIRFKPSYFQAAGGIVVSF